MRTYLFTVGFLGVTLDLDLEKDKFTLFLIRYPAIYVHKESIPTTSVLKQIQVSVNIMTLAYFQFRGGIQQIKTVILEGSEQ